MKNKDKILTYHSIGTNGNGEIGSELYSVSVENFKQQMAYIFHRNSDKGNFCSSPTVTFDDGDITNFLNAYPILKKFNITAYFFIIADQIGTQGYMNWEQIKEMKERGMVIGSHSMRHRILTELKDKDLDYEIKTSKKILEDNLGCKVDYFSVPRGSYNQKVINKIKEAGYKFVFTSNPKDFDDFKLGRIAVRSNWRLDYFANVLNNGLSFMDRSKEVIKNTAKRILGTKGYNKIRTAILKG